MPRQARLRIAGVPWHIIHRGNNRGTCFFDERDYCYYLEQLQLHATEQDVAIHAYVLMTNHVHLLATPETLEGVSVFMKRLSQNYTQTINRTYRRTGGLWEGRYKSSLIDAQTYLLSCYRTIELNPVRAKMVVVPGDYRWSSYDFNGQEGVDPIISPHPIYLALGKTRSQSCAAYRDLFQAYVEPGFIYEFRAATNGGYCFGSKQFKEEISRALGRRVERGKPGRPRAGDV